jgi:RimJ/RimL family protein N-acetyltransferase
MSSALANSTPIETNRLLLREFQRQDLPLLVTILAKPEVMQFSSTGLLSEKQTKAKLEEFIYSYQKHGFGKRAVILKATNQLIGYCGIALAKIDGMDQPEIGYRLAPEFWRQGLATEAALAMLQYGAEQLKLPYTLGIVERANRASVKVLEKIGMRYQRETIFQGVQMDLYRYDYRNDY